MAPPPRRWAGALPPADLDAAFERAIRAVDRARTRGMTTIAGESAAPQLAHLRAELESARLTALESGAPPDTTWLQQTIRWVSDWAPEADIALIAALGAIARAGR